MMKGCFVITICLLFSCTAAKKSVTLSENTRLHFLGKYELPHNLQFKNTTVGGLSGIDYDRKNDLYYLICDDRSTINAARFYTAKLFVNEKGIDSLRFVDVVFLLQPDGTPYPNTKQDPFNTPDPEGIRYDPRKKELIWTNEGERIVKNADTVLVDPAIFVTGTDGKFKDRFIIPSNMRMRSIEQGPRQNGVFEGITFIKNYKRLLVSVEEPLYEDGPRAGLNDSTGLVRMIEFDVASRKAIAQYAYEIDPVAYPSNPANSFKINGIPEILAINDHQLIVIERSFSVGRKSSTIKLFLAELIGAANISHIRELKKMAAYTIQKKLLLNLDSLGIYIDNVEGITLGPVLPNGHHTLVLVADNNFSVEEVTQLFLFEIN